MLTVKCPNLYLVLVGFEEILSLFALITFSDYIVFVYQKKCWSNLADVMLKGDYIGLTPF